MPTNKFGGYNGIVQFFGVYAILDLAAICFSYSLLLRHHEKAYKSIRAKAFRSGWIGLGNYFPNIYVSKIFYVGRARLA